MKLRASALLIAALTASLSALAAAQAKPDDLDRRFRVAVAQYNAGHLSEAAAELEKLVPQAPESFEIQELLGVVYLEQSQDALANPHLEKAVRLNPSSASARTTLATNLVRLGKLDGAEEQFKKAIALEPKNYDTNHNLGELYVRRGKLADALPYLKRAYSIAPSNYDNGYDLSLACLLTGHPADAKPVVQDLLRKNDRAELHNLLGQIDEKLEDYVAAGTEFEAAAQQDPSESNLFDWASELLLHRTLDPAIDVFRQSAARYPNSPRLAIGLGIALYSRGNYDDAVKSLIRAVDMNPKDPRAYSFLSWAHDSAPSQASDVTQRFARFSELQPTNARAHYYYAMSLWKGKRTQDASVDFHQIESLLRKAIALDPKYAEAHLQLGNLYSDQTQYAAAIPEYSAALEHDSTLSDAHYRLGQAYVHTGDKVKAQAQLQVYQQLRAEHLADLDKQRAEIRQFVYSEKTEEPAKQ